jgi:hypothetical protein
LRIRFRLDLYCFGKLDPDPHRSQKTYAEFASESKAVSRIRIRVKNRSLMHQSENPGAAEALKRALDAYLGAVEAQHGVVKAQYEAMEAHYRAAVCDLLD